MAIPEVHSAEPVSVGKSRGLATWVAIALLGLLSLGIWSCNSTSSEDVYTITLKLDSSRVGKFDSVRVEVFNGTGPAAGDTTDAVQVEVIAVTPTTKQVTLTLNGKVETDFSVVVTGFNDDAITYRNLHTVDGFKQPDSSKPAILLISQINAGELTLSVGETRVPALSLTPQDAKDKKIILTSLDPDKVSVVNQDSLKGLAAGTAKVKATTADGAVSVEFAVTVVAVRVTRLESDTLFLLVGDSVPPAVKVVPDNATDKEFALESLDTAIFTVDGKAVKALSEGQGRLVLASRDGGAKDTLIVRVRVPVKGVTAKNLTLEVGDKVLPVLVFDPVNATRRGYVLTTADSSKLAVIGDRDSLEAKAIGQVKVTVKTSDGGFSAEFTVDVVKKVIRVTGIVADNLRALVDDTLAAKVAFTPADASEQGFTLKSLNEDLVAIVDEKLVAKALGSAMVEVSAVDGGTQDTFTVAVQVSDFTSDILPITNSKCAPCHAPPTTFNFDWTDSAQFVRKGTIAISRLMIPEGQPGHMPLKGAVGGDITARELKILLAWLARTAVPLQSIAVVDTSVSLGDSVVPPIRFTPANASNRLYELHSSDTDMVAIRGELLLPLAVGKATITVTMDEAGQTGKFELSVTPPLYEKDVLPIVSIKCAPCHYGPTATYNWQDSTALISSGSEAIRRLGLAEGEKGRMPFAADANGPPNGELTAHQMRVVMAWLHSKVVPLIGITVPNDSVKTGASKEPFIIYNPANASNKTFTLESADTAIVQIDEGKLVGVALGSAVVHVTALDGGFSKFFTVKVIPVQVDSISAHDSAGAIGDTVIPKVDFFPGNATNMAFTVALLKASTTVKVNPGNKVIGLALGKDTLEATSTADPSKKSRFTFTVGPVLPKSLLAADTNGVVNGTSVPIRVTWNPSTTTDKRFTLLVTAGDTLTVAAVRDTLMLPKTATGQVTVRATSVADPSITTSFNFTVGTVSAASISIRNTPIVLAIGSTAKPTVDFLPTNTTNMGYTLTIPAAGAGKMSLTSGGLSILGVHLSAATNIVVRTADGSAKTANWNVTVVRPPMGAANKALIQNRCSACHYTGNASGIPAWWDKTNLRVDSALIVTGFNPDSLIQRLSIDKDMPPTVPALDTATINTMVRWLNTK